MLRNPVLIGLELFAGSVWVGSLICLAVVASAARSVLDPAARTAFFRALGQRYALVGNGALALAIGVGLAMIWPPGQWGRLEDAIAALSAALVIVTALGECQARFMTRLRQRAQAGGEAGGEAGGADPGLAQQVRRGAALAGALRSLIGALSLAVVVVVAASLGH